ncbi:MAG: GNAT family N-acetyltransferase [Oscillospiraceae bacterium]
MMNETAVFFHGSAHPAFADAAMLRKTVFVEEQGFGVDLDERDFIAWHLVLYDRVGPIAVARAFLSGQPGQAVIGRVAVRKAARGTGAGARLMLEMERELRALGIERVELGAQQAAVGFYDKLGYRPFGTPYLDEHCPHRHMEKKL